MNWMSKVPPGIRNFFKRRSKAPADFWMKDPLTGQLVTRPEVEHNQMVIPESGYHLPMTPLERFTWTFDEGIWEALPLPEPPDDPLHFRDSKRYVDRLRESRRVTENFDAVVLGTGLVWGIPMVLAAHDFRFIGGSLGRAAGEAIIAGINEAIAQHAPFVVFTASGGARMQESIISLMQMPRTTIAVARLKEAKLPFIVVLTHPTMGGVTASYAMLGDVHLAEPRALIGFAGKDIIKEITGEDMPDHMRYSEQGLAHGIVDMVVHRHELREKLGTICRLLMKLPPAGEAEAAAETAAT